MDVEKMAAMRLEIWRELVRMYGKETELELIEKAEKVWQWVAERKLPKEKS
jgi:hypothetical protein